MTAHPDNQIFHALKRLAPTNIKQVEAVAQEIGCQEWTGECNRRDQCFCANAAARVVEIERDRT
jgi:hypothetical protein